MAVHRSPFEQSAYAILVEAIGKDAVLVHQVSHENQPAGFRHALRLLKGFQLFVIANEVVQWAEQDGQVCRASGHVVALGHERRGVAARPGANVEQAEAWPQEAVKVVHGGLKLHDAVPALQA